MSDADLSVSAPLPTVRAVVVRAAIIFLLCLTATAPADAQDGPCPPGNLLARKSPSASRGVQSSPRLTNGIITAEGDSWQSELTSTFSDPGSHVVYDLGQSVPITAVDLQGDNNDEYIVELSEDGETFVWLWTADPVSGQGMRRRGAQRLSGQGRYVRLRAQGGDGYYSLSEIQVFCRKSATWPPPVEVKATASGWWKGIMQKRDHRYRLGLAFLGLLFFIALFRVERSKTALGVAVSLALAMLAIASYRFYSARHAPWFADWGLQVLAGLVAAWGVRGLWLARQGEGASLWWERGALVWIILACGAAWVNFGTYHSSRIVHYWDTFHYYIGSKYFEENEYERLYQCVLAADYQDRGSADLQRRKIRDLVDNRLHYLTEEDAIVYTKTCAEHFSPQRWEAFKQDARSFRTVMGTSWWRDMLMDHGYNASPISNMVAAALTNVRWKQQVPETPSVRVDQGAMKKFRKRILRYAMIDLGLYAGAFLLILWAFGLRACALAVALWGTGYPWAYFWTGGSFARVPWFFMAVAAVCLLKKGFPLLSGFALSWSALLRLFPAALAGGPGAAIVDRFIRRKKLEGPWLRPEDKRFIAGGMAGLLVLCSASVAINGVDAHTRFLGNTFKHAETPLTNHMGLPTLLSYRPSTVGRHTKDASLEDPWAHWKQFRKDTKHDRRWLHRLILLGMFVLLALAGRRMAGWAVLASSTILIIGFFELTCYYYSFVVLMAPLAIERLRYTAALIAMVMAGLIIQFFAGWYDEQYLWETAACLVALLYIIVDVVLRPLPESSPAAP
ncbi:MAG: discoidin domain-containing protein [Myxococcales bacterium]|nr:discoidin domain-containing protein [Myxococcales bacterium]MDH3483390.1 discoidin domain-containing protein [Myxococcales bacterium]